MEKKRYMAPVVLKDNNFFDTKMASLGALGMGSIVYYINSEYGIDVASVSAAKQAAYTFLMGGFLAKMAENAATYFKRGSIGLSMAVFTPSIITLGLTYGMHSYSGTPHALESSLPTLAFASPAFLIHGHRKRKSKLEKLIEENL